jgi:UDP-N-acetylmuramate: L-alanyl-gamma-D-glutamyl-meso-diaminopimelate ligase
MSEGLPRSVHFIAIGGTGMGSLAGLLARRGVRVTGSDHALYPPMSTALEEWGIPVFEGFHADRLIHFEVEGHSPDWVVIGNAVRADNPEARAAIEAGYRCASFPDALYELAIAGRHSIVVSGTHGKTTTTSLVAALLHATGRDPGALVGGISLDFGGSFLDGKGPHFVVEGDEYDTAFFDKTPKFLHYHPRTLILTSVEFDHADIYRDLDHVKSAFRELLEGMPEDGTVVAAWGHENVRDVVAAAPCRVVRYGVAGGERDAELDWRADDLRSDSGSDGTGSLFTLHRPGAPPIAVRSPIFGRFNAENVTAALAALDCLGVPLSESVEALRGYRGVKRRMEVRGTEAGVTVIDDFAHHPTAVAGTIEAVRSRYPGRRLLAVFEPRSNTSRRRIFQEAYARSFDGADGAVVRRVPDEPVYSATGEVTELFSADELAAALAGRGVPCAVAEDVDDLVDHLAATCRSGDVVLVMSNGAFGGIWEKLLEALRKGGSHEPES